jgi:hypothetical protein
VKRRIALVQKLGEQLRLVLRMQALQRSVAMNLQYSRACLGFSQS